MLLRDNKRGGPTAIHTYIYIYMYEVTFPRPVKSLCSSPTYPPSGGKTALPTPMAHPEHTQQNHVKTAQKPTITMVSATCEASAHDVVSCLNALLPDNIHSEADAV